MLGFSSSAPDSLRATQSQIQLTLKLRSTFEFGMIGEPIASREMQKLMMQ